MEAPKPFDSTALADTVLRSSNNVHFYVLGAFLRYVSPTFRDLFSLGKGSAESGNEIKDGHPVVPLSEDSKTIHCLLSIIYPSIDEPDLVDGRLLIKVWRMAEKYEMDMVVGKVQKHLLKDQWLKDQPHRTFVISSMFGWNYGLEKAKQILGDSESWEKIPYYKEFEDINGTEYYRLLEHLFRRGYPEQPGQQQMPLSGGQGGNSDGIAVNASASKPFDSSAKADIILRSSDAIDFYVYRPFLEMISPAFEHLFSGTEASESAMGLSVVCVTDHSEALRYFLLVLHHRIDTVPVENPGLIADICTAARRYKTPTVEARMKEQLTASSSPVQRPLCVYAIATTLGWDDVAKVAAKNTLGTPLENVMTCIPELGRITGGDLHRLLKYRTRCAEVACRVVKKSDLHRLSLVGSGGYAGSVVMTALFASINAKLEKELTACPRGSTYAISCDRLFDSLEVRQSRQSVPACDIPYIIRGRTHVAQAIEGGIDKVIFAPALQVTIKQ